MLAVLAAAAAITNVGVGEREWSISVYRPVVDRGAVRFNVHNFGEDGHDLQVRGPAGFRSRALPEIPSGENGVLTVRFKRSGRYTLVCTLPGHAQLGMRATLRVR